MLLVGDGVADARIGDLLDGGGEEADLAGPQLVERLLLGAEDADALDLVGAARGHQADALAFLEAPSMTRTSTITPR